jgi:hypothetical protein
LATKKESSLTFIVLMIKVCARRSPKPLNEREKSPTNDPHVVEVAETPAETMKLLEIKLSNVAEKKVGKGDIGIQEPAVSTAPVSQTQPLNVQAPKPLQLF